MSPRAGCPQGQDAQSPIVGPRFQGFVRVQTQHARSSDSHFTDKKVDTVGWGWTFAQSPALTQPRRSISQRGPSLQAH